MTKAIIDGLLYDTESAEYLGEVKNEYDNHLDFAYWEAALFVTKNGRYFLDGHGGPSSAFAEKRPDGGHHDGTGIRAITKEEAVKLALECDGVDGDTLIKQLDLKEA